MASAAKVLSVGLGDLVSSRNASLRTVGFEVVAATSFVEVVQQCSTMRFDVSIVGHAFSLLEHTEFVRCLQGMFHLPVILIADGPALSTLRADLHVEVDAPLKDLISAIGLLSGEKPYQRAAS